MAREDSVIAGMNIGQARTVLKPTGQDPLSLLLQEIIQDVVTDLGKSLDSYGVNASRSLRQSIKPTKATVTNRGVEIAISAEHYWKFINYGVNGFKVQRGAPQWGAQPKEGSFKDSILQWIKDKGIVTQFGSYDSMAFAIMNKVRAEGQEARPFFTDVVNKELYNKMKAPIAKIMKRSIEVVIIDPWQ